MKINDIDTLFGMLHALKEETNETLTWARAFEYVRRKMVISCTDSQPFSGESCAFCIKTRLLGDGVNTDCSLCPIPKKTGRTACRNTPYYTILDAPIGPKRVQLLAEFLTLIDTLEVPETRSKIASQQTGLKVGVTGTVVDSQGKFLGRGHISDKTALTYYPWRVTFVAKGESDSFSVTNEGYQLRPNTENLVKGRRFIAD